MQRQQEQEPDTQGTPKRRRGRQSFGEVIAAWLLIAWGVFISIVSILFPNITGGSLLWFVLLLLHGGLCYFAGAFVLLRYRNVAKLFLYGAAMGLIGIGLGIVQLILNHNRMPEMDEWVAIAIFGVVAALFFFIGRWVGQQEDATD